MVSFKDCRDIMSISNNPVIHTSRLNTIVARVQIGLYQKSHQYIDMYSNEHRHSNLFCRSSPKPLRLISTRLQDDTIAAIPACLPKGYRLGQILSIIHFKRLPLIVHRLASLHYPPNSRRVRPTQRPLQICRRRNARPTQCRLSPNEEQYRRLDGTIRKILESQFRRTGPILGAVGYMELG